MLKDRLSTARSLCNRMNRLLTTLALALTAGSSVAQTYSLNWATIDGGGGRSTGGVFTVQGTIGQPDAGGPMTGGSFSVTGGFWALPIAVQTPGAPTLTITRLNATQERISWAPNTPGFVLQETAILSPPNWLNSPSGAANPVTVTSSPNAKFYRLNKP